MNIKTINELENEVFCNIGRASDLLWIHFGEMMKIKNYKGIEVEKGSYGIHVQCPWRFLHYGKLILGNKDIYIPREGVSESEFDWCEIGESVFDEKVQKIRQNLLPVKVKEVFLDSIGNFKIEFENKLVFEAIPNSSVETEFWRFINNKTKEHMVIFD